MSMVGTTLSDRMVENDTSGNSASSSSSGISSTSSVSATNNGGSANALNIYSTSCLRRPSFLAMKSASTNSVTSSVKAAPTSNSKSGASASSTSSEFPFIMRRDNMNGKASSNGKETVNLVASKEYRIDELQNCSHVADVEFDDKDMDKGHNNNTVVVFDLTTAGCLLYSDTPAHVSSSGSSVENGDAPNKEVYRIHLSLPSTLVKRPKFHFEKLLRTIIDDSKRLKLMNLIDNCDTFLFFDGTSTITKCSLTTYWLIKKFHAFLHDKIGKSNLRLYILEKMDTNLEQPFDYAKEDVPTASGENCKNRNSTAPQKKLNLTIKILPKSTDKMFIQSIKKDAIHYSPNSLKKYFKFHIPTDVEDSDPILPNWLKPFSKKSDNDIILQKLLKNFEYLENLELKRLERGLNSDRNDDSLKLQDSNSYHKIYSLSNLQKEFTKQKKIAMKKPNSCPSSPCFTENDLKLSIPKQQPVLGPPSMHFKLLNSTESNSSPSSSHVDTDSDSLLTPMDNYQVSQGIQSFTKNRYSNILPYEHSRVKLQPSPIHGPTSTNTGYSPSSNLSSTHIPMKKTQDDSCLSNSNNKKRRNSFASSQSYFNQITDPFQRDKGQNRCDTTSKESFNDYFNANYLKLPKINGDFTYIATQAPLPSTIDDFWKVISSNGVKVIISLNSNDELFMRKWDVYWNNNRSDQKYKIDITETFENACNVDGCILRIFTIYKKEEEKDSSIAKSTVYQLQYTKWLDSCGIVMQDILNLHTIKNMLLNNPLALLSDLRAGINKDAVDYSDDVWTHSLTKEKEKSAKQPPLLVHCSAGCGRTGVFITLDFLLNVLTQPTNSSNSIDVWNMSQDLIFITVNELRKQRISMVQNLTQYITCYESILEYFSLIKKQKGRQISKGITDIQSKQQNNVDCTRTHA